MHLRRSAPWVGIAGLVVVLWLYVVSGLVVPWWAVVALLVWWCVLLALSLRWAGRRPYVVLAMPVVAVGVWAGVVSAGGALLGWSA